MWKDVIDSLRLNWISRTSSPLFGALSISWLVWNHRLLFALFADKPVAWRFAYIDTALYPDVWRFIAFNVLGPVASAIAYLYLFPYPTRKVFEFTLNRKRELNEIAQRIEGQRLLTEDEAQTLRRQFDEGVAERARMVEGFNETERTLRSANELLAKKLRESQAEVFAAEAQGIPQRPDEAITRLRAFLTSRPFMLVFNHQVPRDKGSKRMMLGEGGSILMGKNTNETSWDINNKGQLEFRNADGAVHSQFDFMPQERNFRGSAMFNHQAQSLHPASLE